MPKHSLYCIHLKIKLPTETSLKGKKKGGRERIVFLKYLTLLVIVSKDYVILSQMCNYLTISDLQL